MAIGGRGPAVVAVLWTEIFLSAIFIGLRLYARKFVVRGIGWDDYTLIATWILTLAFIVMLTVSAVLGLGKHADDLTLEAFGNALLFEVVGQFFASLATGMGKVTVSLFLIRIVVERWHKAILWFCIITMMILGTVLGIGAFTQCTPTRSIWDPRLASERVCHMNFVILAKVVSGWAAAVDFFLALLPWFVLWNVQMKKKDKIIVCTSLSLGIFAGACGAIRTSGLDALSQTADYLYVSPDIMLWTSTELTLTIVCVSISCLRPLWSRIRGNSSGGYHEHPGPNSQNGTSYGLKHLPSESHIYTKEVSRGDGNDDADTESSKGILTQGPAIHRVQEFTVAYEDAKSNSSTRNDVEAQPVMKTVAEAL